ncbi:MAG: site-specific DNA-methyltransferase [Chloroflexota bacterium]
MVPKRKSQNNIPVEHIKHKDTRANIPTEELRDFVADEERQPKTMLYPRDPSLDPQLVWKGKDEQDQHPLEVPVVPIYIQEKISPQAIIENVRQQAQKDQPAQLNLFADFNGLPFEDMVDFYHHEQNWTNRMILGDSLLVMTSLAEKEGLKGRVQMIYMDPPYGIEFGSNWQVSTRKRDVKDGKIEDATRQPEQIKAFRDTWQLGIHSYLAYMRDRLVVSRELLTESGSIFVQIGGQNLHLVALLLDEVFDSENRIELLSFRKKGMPLTGVLLEGSYDYILWYAKDKKNVKFRKLFKEMITEGDSHWDWIQLPDNTRRKLAAEEISNHKLIPSQGKIYQLSNLYPSGTFATGFYDFDFEGRQFSPPAGRCWKTPIQGMTRMIKANRLQPYQDGKTIRHIIFEADYPVSPIDNIWTDTAPPSDKVYVVQTARRVIERCILMATDPGDLVLDPTCGSGTTAYVAEQWGRRWITIDTSRVAIALARTRLMAARFPYYLLADSPEGIKKEAELSGQLPPSPLPPTINEIKKGFVYRRVPHITLKSIANNEEIDVIHAKWQEQLEPLRARINQAAGKNWQEWEIPRLPSPFQSEKERVETEKALRSAGILPDSETWKLIEEWWNLRRQRQKEIDESIARHADMELLYDQPYEDSKKIRVTGPFTVESLSPHRVLSTDEERPQSEVAAQKQAGAGQFEAMIIENLRTAGVQNTKKNERLKFSRLEPYAGTWIHAAGEYQEKDGTVRRAAVTIGPEHGTVGPDLIKEAAKEAVQGIGFDLLIVLGFAFDPHVLEEARRYGTLTVLPTRINPDLQMGGELLKKTGSGNLFMVFGEPDIEIRSLDDGKIVVEIHGVDVYDPTTGEIRSSSTDDIACWFIDTNYNGESFFVRHAYFTGADEPYEKLKRALRAEIDESAWSNLYSTTSYPFEKPETGKIAVKVINHYGDEVLKVYKVA